jgi:uncharacterized protein
MTSLEATDRSRVRRREQRASYDRELVHRILDEALVCQVAFAVGEQPFVLPTNHGRLGDTLYLHGAVASRMLSVLAGGIPVCVTVTLLDGLVLARSAFHHSMNYRSVVLFGNARKVTDPDEIRSALEAIVEHVVPGRSRHARPPSDAELAATSVVALPIDEGSAKIRSGPPIDAAGDLAHPAWAGVIPLRLVPGAAEPAAELVELPTPPHVWRRSLAPGDVREEQRGDLQLSSDPRRLDLELIHDFLSRRSYWARGVERWRVERAIRGSLSVGVYRADAQLGFARLVTDRATFAYLCDVFVIEPERGRGIASAMLEFWRSDPALAGMRKWLLGTLDAHGLYERFGFQPLENPERMLEICTPYPY